MCCTDSVQEKTGNWPGRVVMALQVGACAQLVCSASRTRTPPAKPLLGTCVFRDTLHFPLTGTKFSVESLGVSPLQTVDQGNRAACATLRASLRVQAHQRGPDFDQSEEKGPQQGAPFRPLR
ncbi:hypothetical protein CB1_000140009 [Camelus ferus]|nr:hypothetical protein CB1_000140009 [Camelus ferus]